jgi:hypothetical protein
MRSRHRRRAVVSPRQRQLNSLAGERLSLSLQQCLRSQSGFVARAQPPTRVAHRKGPPPHPLASRKPRVVAQLR